jgi:hypothetical protein
VADRHGSAAAGESSWDPSLLDFSVLSRMVHLPVNDGVDVPFWQLLLGTVCVIGAGPAAFSYLLTGGLVYYLYVVCSNQDAAFCVLLLPITLVGGTFAAICAAGLYCAACKPHIMQWALEYVRTLGQAAQAPHSGQPASSNGNRRRRKMPRKWGAAATHA